MNFVDNFTLSASSYGFEGSGFDQHELDLYFIEDSLHAAL